MPKLGLNYGEFKLVPEGDQVLKIKSFKYVPEAKPTKLIIEFEDVNGGIIKSEYKLSNTTAVFAFTMVYSTITGATEPEIELKNTAKLLVGKFIKCKIAHTNVNKVVDEVETDEILTFANVKKAISKAEGFGSVKIEAAVEADADINIDDDDDDDLSLDD